MDTDFKRAFQGLSDQNGFSNVFSVRISRFKCRTKKEKERAGKNRARCVLVVINFPGVL